MGKSSSMSIDSFANFDLLMRWIPLQRNRFRLVAAAVVGAAVAGALAIIYCFDPGDGGYPLCPFHQLTGLYCPGCGTLRAIHQLLHGNVSAALALNPLAVCLVPALIASAVWTHGIRRPTAKQTTSSRPRGAFNWAWFLLLVVVAFWILRNVPAYPFTLLAPH
jgi:hypothetical protein